MLRLMSGDGSEETWKSPRDRPVLPVGARTGPERYPSTELLALQKEPEEWVHCSKADGA